MKENIQPDIHFDEKGLEMIETIKYITEAARKTARELMPEARAGTLPEDDDELQVLFSARFDANLLKDVEMYKRASEILEVETHPNFWVMHDIIDAARESLEDPDSQPPTVH